MKKAQIAYEFLFMFFVLTASFTTWIIFSSSTQGKLTYEKEELHLHDIGLQIQDDLYTAVQMPDGYQRTLQLPGTLLGKTYTVLIYDATPQQYYAAITSGEHVAEFSVPPVIIQSPLKPGENTIVKEAGIVTIN